MPRREKHPTAGRTLLSGWIKSAFCGNGLARDGGVSVEKYLSDTPLSRASPLPPLNLSCPGLSTPPFSPRSAWAVTGSGKTDRPSPVAPG
ncbi:hypothetical protein F0169_02870 [Pseudomonas sp. MAFF 212408]|uniref:Uncharacterized protein n=1 Tax=Pseudomonas kitaguniensis TaxID=2607908 RepID=A0A5N7KG66_9PSED|nr:hypothetical protein [Pseudomonas kitaguniensis]